MNEIKIGVIEDEKLAVSIVNNDAPIIKGIAIKNENRIASFLLTPKSNNVDIVIPDLDIPGNKANIWNKPTTITRFKDNFFDPSKYFVEYKTIPVKRNE